MWKNREKEDNLSDKKASTNKNGQRKYKNLGNCKNPKQGKIL